MADTELNHAEPVEARWLVWGRSAFAVAVVVAARRARRREHRDVRAVARGRGRRALGRARRRRHRDRGRRRHRRPRPPASQRGDVLLAVNGAPVQTPADVVEYQHRGHDGHAARLHAAAARDARRRSSVALAPAPRGSSMYFVLAAVGLFTLLVGASVRLRRPRDQATLHFFWLCVAFFGVFTFSFNGPFDRLDWVFYWGDAVAMALLPPLLLHFTLVFPERPTDDAPNVDRARLDVWLVPLMYLPALVLGAARVIAVARASQGTLSGPLFSRVARRARSRRAGLPVRLRGGGARRAGARVPRDHVGHRRGASCAGSRGARRSASVRSRSATRCRGRSASNPPLALQLTADPARPRAADVRVGDRPLPAARRRGHHQARPRLHRVSRRQRRALRRRCCKLTGFVFVNDADEHNWIIALLATLVVVLLARPVKDAVQNALDRAVLPRSLRLPPRAGRLRARPEQRPRRRPAQPAAGRAHRRNAGASIAWR